MDDEIKVEIASLKAVVFGANGAPGLSQTVKDIQQQQHANRDDLYASLETVKNRINGFEADIAAIKASANATKWMVGIGFTVIGIGLALFRMIQ